MKMIQQKIFFIVLLQTCILLSCRQSRRGPEAGRQPAAPVTSVAGQEIPLWAAVIPDSNQVTGIETYHDGMVSNVSHPTITVFHPQGNNTGAAILVFPGGGYNKLAIDLEGSEICQWLASKGITAVLLKYRVPASGPHWDKDCKCEMDPVRPLALEDAQRAMGLVRLRAEEWQIDPHRIGVMGFSAGGHLVADISTNYRRRTYAISDTADRIDCRPDFGIALYPGHMTFHATKPYMLNPGLPVDAHTPPTFILQAGDDPVDTIQNSLVYYIALKKAGVPVEYHIYAEGGHAFGLQGNSSKTKDWDKLPIADWETLVERWLRTIHMINGQAAAGK